MKEWLLLKIVQLALVALLVAGAFLLDLWFSLLTKPPKCRNL